MNSSSFASFRASRRCVSNTVIAPPNIAAPQRAVEAPQHLGFGQLAPADVTGYLYTALPQVVPIQNHCVPRELMERRGEEATYPARAIGDQQQRAKYTQC